MLNPFNIRLQKIGCFLKGTVLVGAVLFSVVGCSGAGLQTVDNNTIQATEVSSQPTSQQNGEYRLGAGDKIKLTVYNEEDISGEYDLGAKGVVSLPLVGQVRAGGLTVPEFQKHLAQKLSVYIRNPRVSAHVVNYRPFYIRGEVKNGGEYPYSNGLVVADAVAKAGGYTYRAVTSYVYIRRSNENSERKYSLNAPVRVLPGDNIRIPERYF